MEYHLGKGGVRQLPLDHVSTNIPGQLAAASNPSSSASDAGPSASAGASAGNKRLPSGCCAAVHCGYPLGGDGSLCIDAMMNYEFQRTNSESFYTTSPFPSLSLF